METLSPGAAEVDISASEFAKQEKTKRVISEITRIRELYHQICNIDQKVAAYKSKVGALRDDEEVPTEWVEDMRKIVHADPHKVEDFMMPPGALFAEIYGRNISHDIKNIQQRLVFYQFAIDSLEDGDLRQFVNDWEYAAANWEAYYYTMLDYAARAKNVIEGGKGDIIDPRVLETEGKKVDARELLDVLIRFIKDRTKKHEGVSVHYPDSLPDNIVADIAPGVVFNKLANILLNPIRKTDTIRAKNVWIEVSVDGEGEKKNLVITVSDDGIGMDEEIKSHIFEGGFSTTKGKGIGLAYADTLFNQMNCTIHVESNPASDRAGNGEVHTTFTVVIPLSA